MKIYKYTVNINDIIQTDIKPFKKEFRMVIDESEYATKKDVKELQKHFEQKSRERRPFEETLEAVFNRVSRSIKEYEDEINT